MALYRLPSMISRSTASLNKATQKRMYMHTAKEKNPICTNEQNKHAHCEETKMTFGTRSLHATTLSTLGYLPDGSPARLVLVEGAPGVENIAVSRLVPSGPA